VTFPATIAVDDSSVSVKSEFSINRKDFGIVYAGKADDLIRDDVVIKLDLNASRKNNLDIPVKGIPRVNLFLSRFHSAASFHGRYL
jgi:hypothetical protein